MAQATNGILAYGYDLGSGEDWRVREAAGEFGELAVPWYDPADPEQDFPSAAENALLTAAEFADLTEKHAAGGYSERRQSAREQIGVEVETYCSDGYPMYVLAARTVTVRRGEIADVGELAAGRGSDHAARDDRLRWALAALGLTPAQEQPSWLLCSYASGF